MEHISFFSPESFQFLEVRFSTYLNRHVYIMSDQTQITETIFQNVVCCSCDLRIELLFFENTLLA